jgi:hypothetical protein
MRLCPSQQATFARMVSLLNSGEGESSFFANTLDVPSNIASNLFRGMAWRGNKGPRSRRGRLTDQSPCGCVSKRLP